MKPLRVVYALAYVGLLATAFLVFNDLPPDEAGLVDWFFDQRERTAVTGTSRREGWQMAYIDEHSETPYAVRILSLETGDRDGWYGKVEYELRDMNTGDSYVRCAGARWKNRQWVWALVP